MNFNNPNTKSSTVLVKMVCAIVFILFSFVYLYFYQIDMLSMAQHVLSGGATRYNGLIGALLITAVLLVMQWCVMAVCRLSGKYHALTYFPSLLVMAAVTDIGPEMACGFSLGAWLWGVPLGLLLWGILVCILRKIQLYESRAMSGGLFSRMMWINMMTMTVMFSFVGTVSGGNTVFHYRMHIEDCLLRNDTGQALDTGRKSLETDPDLTMLRIYALALEGWLGDELFTYPVSGTSNDIIPSKDGTRCLMYPDNRIYKFIGAKPAKPVDALPFLKGLIEHGLATEAVNDYILCGCLIDRNLDAFVYYLPKFYEVNDSLPKHYREALTLYTHQKSSPVIVYHNVVMDTDFEDLQSLERQYGTESARKRKVYGQYSGTYWWYYKYMK